MPPAPSSQDLNPRPHKRQRIQPHYSSSPDPLSMSDLSSLPSSFKSTPDSQPQSQPKKGPKLKPIPTSIMLVSLPSILAHPPNHKHYIHSLVLSLTALRKCLSLPSISPQIEVRAWAGIAEIGMRVISGGFSQSEEHPWAKDIEFEVEKALSKGHPSLRAYSHQLSLLQVQLSQWQQKIKFARNQIRTLIASFLPNDPPHAVNALPTSPTTTSQRTPSLLPASAQDVYAALDAIQTVEDLATAQRHNQVAILARVLRTRTLVAAGLWADVRDAIVRAEEALGLSYEPATTPRRQPLQPSQSQTQGSANANGGEGTMPAQHQQQTPPPQEQTFITFEDPMERRWRCTYSCFGEAAEAAPRLSHLHALMDSEVLEKFPEGWVELHFSSSPSLFVQVTHPRVLFLLTFLVSSVSKRDACGRKPKRKLFAAEGLASWETEVLRDISFSLWSDGGDMQEVEERLARIKADLLCELIAVSIMRSEFDTAEETLNVLIAHARTANVFHLFSSRIALHHAHLAHALARPARALRCYRTAAHHADPKSDVYITARAAQLALRIGMERRRAAMGDGWLDGLSKVDDEWPHDYEDEDGLEREGAEVIKMCRKGGGALEAIAQIIEACLTSEHLKAKQHLKRAMELASKAQDNHMRALVLSLITAHYLNTFGDHARSMLETCDQLAAGLGAPSVKGENNGKPALGNAPLRLWVGERFLELYKRFGKESRVQKQASFNAQLEKAVSDIALRVLAAAG
ncbi:uncharacterized protein BXZ73DRAFT_93243 [Epithele typhae]|uniref:uncharacterized protein n=1 Tax=Epithele typhae TaxID=378194 RepID=UPI0020087BB9|nr:uncharacterized protein BXZ73DRAFT_93243 [Epithele typhae]KAH9912151.1 hypothetical protein BXZ73DRAFT_93243 [Epithele typhae]